MQYPLSVIFTTYNEPEWLKKVLWGFECQTFNDFEVIIADDGSGEETRSVIDKFKSESDLSIQHIWHPDEGYQKCQILNKAVVASRGDYLVFTDGDCIPREDFISEHNKAKKEGQFISGGAVRLPMTTSKEIGREDIYSQKAFDLDWLLEKGLEKKYFKNLKLTKSKTTSRILNAVTPANATWNGGNSSGWKSDLLSVNGFDERMLYGGQDRELGERLVNKGLKPMQLRFSAICIHLDHSRGYKNEESIQKNLAIRKETREKKLHWTDFGIEKK